jgi:hypothetical protein
MSTQTHESVLVNRISDLRSLSKNASSAMVTPGRKIKAKKKKVAAAAMNVRLASGGMTGGFGAGYGGGSGGFGGGSMMGNATNIYSPQLSTDFLELPQTVSEKRSYYRHFYNRHPYVGQAIDLHTDLPLSKIRLTLPKGNDPKRNRNILNFYQEMVDRLDLLQVLVEATREYYIIGEAFLFAEDTPVEVPDAIYYELIPIIDENGDVHMQKKPRPNAKELESSYLQKHYKGWNNLMVLPPDQVHLESFQFSSKNIVELVPDVSTTNLVQKALSGDPMAIRQFQDIPEEIRTYLQQGLNIPLGTDPNEGSFVYHLARSKPKYAKHGVSLLERCLDTLVYRDKLRQTQTSIASRAMTPKRLIYAEDLDVHDVEELREQVDLALADPDYSIIANYQVNWEEISSNDRLLNLSSEYDITDRLLFAGLGVTESMLTGESSYSGERINIEIINNRYLLYRDHIQNYVQEQIFKPVALKKGFYEYDEYDNLVILYPKLSFTRLAVRDNRDTFDSLFNLYQKGSLSVDFILELFNLDPEAVRERLERDLFTVNDTTFNEAVRSILSDAGRKVIEESDFTEKLIEYLSKVSQFDISHKPPEEGSSRF